MTRTVSRRRIEQVRFVFRHDPALDPACLAPCEGEESSAYDRYVESDYTAFDLLKFVGEPVVIHAKPLSGRQKEICYELAGVSQHNTIARCCIEKITGMPLQTPIAFAKEGSKGVCITPEWWYGEDLFITEDVTDLAAAFFRISEARAPLFVRSDTPSGRDK